MVDALISVVLEHLISSVLREARQEVKLVLGAPEEVDNLTATLTMIRAVVEDAELNQVKNPAVKVWLELLQEICYDSDDVLDEWKTRILISQVQKLDNNKNDPMGNKVRHYLLSLCSCLKPVLVRHDVSHKMKKIRERLDRVAKGKDQLNLLERRSNQEPTRPVTSSLVDESQIFGRDDIKKTIVSQLLSESSRRDLGVPVISIVGTGGFGKTTLAQIILKEQQVVAKFRESTWVCVSEPFVLEKVARDIIEQAQGNAPNTAGWETLHKKLSEAVKEKLFLLVLDDVWSYDDKIWGSLKLSLDGGALGSRIIITTRDESVAQRMRSSYIHRLEELPEADCWSLFRHIAFRGRQKDLEKLEEVGKKIAKKCKGVPLAARILASLMSSKESQRDWWDVLESDIWEVLSEDGNGFLPELWLSYYALPSHLKQCFMYCAIFRKDAQMEKVELVKLWMAQGFLGSDGTEPLEKKGAGYFDNLAMRSFFQDFKKDGEGHIISCKMHDLVHDFAQFLTKCEPPTHDMNGQEFSYIHGRHLSASNLENSSIYEQKNIRTLRPFGEKWIGTMPLGLLHQLSCLRVLNLCRSELEKLPVEVDRLLHLRYLGLSRTRLKELPETMCSLLNLQTLKLNECYYLSKLAQEIGKLSNLRHLEIGRTDALHYLPQSIGRLCSLRTLSKFIVGGEGEGCKIDELKLLNNLEGSLEITVMEQVADVNKVAHAELQQKKNLRSLRLHFGGYVSYGNGMEIVREGLQPHSNLESLELIEYPELKLPFWISLLSNLVSLNLYSCKCLQLPCLGNLASLEFLSLYWLTFVINIGCEFYGADSGTVFPRLRTLYIEGMASLEELEFPVSKDRNVMPCLSGFTVTYCNKLRVITFPEGEAVFPVLCELSIKWNKSLQEVTGVGRLNSLEYLRLEKLESMERLGLEFLGISSVSNGGGDLVLIFPKLRRLWFQRLNRWQDWVLPLQNKNNEFFPHLHELKIQWCPKLRALPALGKLKSLQTLKLQSLDSVEHLGSEFLGISSENGESFPHLTHLELCQMPNWEEKGEMLLIEKGLTTIMPCLHTLEINDCPKLKVVPQYMFSRALRCLVINSCPELTGMQTCCPPLLEHVTLVGDVGVLSRSLPISRLPGNNYPHLHTFKIRSSPHSSLPEGFDRLTAIQKLEILGCEFFDFMPGDLKHQTMLQEVEIQHCPILSEHFRKRENWSTILHNPKITTYGEEILFTQ